MINIKKINLKYDEQIIFEKAEINIFTSKITTIIGPSGSGKTSLLNMINLISSNQDYIYMYDNNMIDLTSDEEKSAFRSKNMIYITQDVSLIEHMTVFENFRLFAKKENLTNEEVISTLKKVNLDIDLSMEARNLSKGQKQRLLIGASLLSDASILLLDEPTSALDADNKKDLLTLIRQLVDSEGMTVVIATHDDYVKQFSDYVYMIDNKKIISLSDNPMEDRISSPSKKSVHKNKKNLFLYNLSYEMKHLITNLLLIVVSAIIIGFGVSFITLSKSLTEQWSNTINVINENVTKIEKKEQLDEISTVSYPVSFEDINNIKSIIDKPEKVLPFYSLNSIFFNYKTQSMNSTSTLIYDGNSQAYQLFSIQPYFDEKSIRESLCVQTSSPKGVYIPEELAYDLNIDLSKNDKLSINDIAITLYDLELKNKGTKDIFHQNLDKMIDLDNVHISGILSNGTSDCYDTPYNYVIYMSSDELERIYHQNKQDYPFNSLENEIAYIEKNNQILTVNEPQPTTYLYLGTLSNSEIKEISEINPLLSISIAAERYSSYLFETQHALYLGACLVVVIELFVSVMIVLAYIFRFKSRSKEIMLLKSIGYSYKDIRNVFVIDGAIKSMLIYLGSILTFMIFKNLVYLVGYHYNYLIIAIISLLLSLIPNSIPTIYACLKCKNITIEKIR